MYVRLELMMSSLVKTYYCVLKYSNIYNLLSTVVKQLLTGPRMMKTWWVSLGWRLKVDRVKLSVIRVSDRRLSVVVSNMSWGNILYIPTAFFIRFLGSWCWGFWRLWFGVLGSYLLRLCYGYLWARPNTESTGQTLWYGLVRQPW